MTRRRALVAVVIVSVLAACSGGGGSKGDDGSGTSTQASGQGPAPTGFAAAGNALCQKLADDDKAGRAALGPAPSADDYAVYVRGSFGPEAISTYQQISAIPYPAGQADTINALLTDVVAEIRLIESDPAVGGSRLNQTDLIARLAAVGLTSCGVGFSHVLDKTSYLAEVNSICANLAGQIAREVSNSKITADSKEAQRAALVRNVLLPLYRSGLDQIEAIGYPPGDEAALAPVVADSKTRNSQMEANPDLFFQAADPLGHSISQRWHDYGATSCG